MATFIAWVDNLLKLTCQPAEVHFKVAVTTAIIKHKLPKENLYSKFIFLGLSTDFMPVAQLRVALVHLLLHPSVDPKLGRKSKKRKCKHFKI